MRDRSIISGEKGHEYEEKVCKLYGKHCKWAAGLLAAIFKKLTSEARPKDIGKTAQRIFRGIGTGLFGCGEDGCR